MTKEQLLENLDDRYFLRRTNSQPLYHALKQFIEQDTHISTHKLKQAGVPLSLINRYRLLILDFQKLQHNLYY